MFPDFFEVTAIPGISWNKQVTTYSKRKGVGKKDPWVFNITFEENKMTVNNMFLVKGNIFGVKLFSKIIHNSQMLVIYMRGLQENSHRYHGGRCNGCRSISVVWSLEEKNPRGNKKVHPPTMIVSWGVRDVCGIARRCVAKKKLQVDCFVGGCG